MFGGLCVFIYLFMCPHHSIHNFDHTPMKLGKVIDLDERVVMHQFFFSPLGGTLAAMKVFSHTQLLATILLPGLPNLAELGIWMRGNRWADI